MHTPSPSLRSGGFSEVTQPEHHRWSGPLPVKRRLELECQHDHHVSAAFSGIASRGASGLIQAFGNVHHSDKMGLSLNSSRAATNHTMSDTTYNGPA